MTSNHSEEVASGQRFAFGENWRRFLSSLDEDRIRIAEASLKAMLGVSDLRGQRFLDVGSGSGLFSLAARRLGATVRSFDYDPASVACTTELRRRFFPDDAGWTVEQGSVLDAGYTGSLGEHDIVYSWGVLHHTGAMWAALENVSVLVRPGGRLFIAIYNDQGWASKGWLSVKKAYNRLPPGFRWTVLLPATAGIWAPSSLRDLFRGRPFATWRGYARGTARGMSPWRDVVDWVGGLPFEVAKPEQIFDFFSGRGFQLRKLKTCAGGLGCNEFVFMRAPARPESRGP